MKKILFILLIISIKGYSQPGIVLAGDTVKSFDPLTHIYIQLTKLIPSQSGQSGKVVSTDGTNFLWSTPFSGAWGSITGAPTTLSGYGITDAVANTITVNGHALSSNVTVTAGDLSLGNVTNTSDANKPVSTAQQTALDLKANLASPTFTGTVGGITASMVGLGSVSNNAQLTIANNLSDLNSAATARTNLGGTTVGKNIFTLTNPSAVTFIRMNADNTITARTAAETLSDIGAQASGSYQPLDADLTTIAGLTATTDNFIVSVASAWASRTPAQVKTTLALDNVTNESKATMHTNSTFTGTFTAAAGSIANAALANSAVANLSGTNTGDQTTVSGNAGSATILQTTRSIYGNNFDGSAALAQIIASTFGGTGNGFTKFSGPATSEKTFTLPNASATVLTDNAVVTAAQGGTGINNSTRTLTISTNAGTIAFPGASTTMTFPSTTATIARSDAANTFTGIQTFSTAIAIASGGTNNGSLAVTQGSIYYGDGSKLVALAPGTTGQVLQTQGAGANPQWFTVTGTGDMILNAQQQVTALKIFDPGKILLSNTTANPALAVDFSSAFNTTALTTTATKGTLEFDANAQLYYSHAAGERGTFDVEQTTTLTTAYTLTSQTAAQKAFNSTTNGRITLASNKSYYFECFISLTAMSASSGSFGFAFGGTATLTRQAWWSNAIKAALATAGTSQGTYNTAANVTLVTANTTTTGWMRINGKIVVGTGGTLIPSVSLGVAATAIVGNDSYFRIWPVGSNTVQNVGNWD